MKPTGKTGLRAQALLATAAVLAALTANSTWAQDQTAPSLAGLTLSPTALDVTASPRDLTLTLHVTDGSAGFQRGALSFQSSSGRQSLNQYFDRASSLVSGTANDGIYQLTVTFPQSIESGVWQLAQLNLVDNANNQVQLSRAELLASGFAPQLTITSAPDTVAPALVGLGFTPGAMDLTAGSQSITVTLHVTDAQAGFQCGTIRFQSASGGQTHAQSFDRFANLSAGDIHDGTYLATVVFPQSIEPGMWHLAQVSLTDGVNNQIQWNEAALAEQGFPTELPVASIRDTTPPALAQLSYTPGMINVVSSPQSVAVTLRATDSLAGFESATVTFQSPSGQQFQSQHLDAGNLISGDVHDGTYQALVSFPQFIESGSWRLAEVDLVDRVGNQTSYNQADLIANAIATQLDVASTPDTAGPVLQSFSLTRASIDLSSSAPATGMTLHVQDALAGFQSGTITFQSPEADQSVAANFDVNANLTTGSANDGYYRTAIAFDGTTATGTWSVIQIQLRDALGNTTRWDATTLAAAGYSTQLTVTAGVPPKVTQVLVSSSAWAAKFRTFLCASGLGSGGYALPVGSSSQLLSLPWINLDEIKIVFNKNVTVKRDDLSIRGVKLAAYLVDIFAYDPGTFTATWTLSAPLGLDKLLLDLSDNVLDAVGTKLDGDWVDASSRFPSGDGVPGGHFRFRVNCLPGSANQDSSENILDVVLVRNRQFTSPGSPNYTVFHDLNGDGAINILDVVLARNRQFTSLPAAEP